MIGLHFVFYRRRCRFRYYRFTSNVKQKRGRGLRFLWFDFQVWWTHA